ncbi:MAG: hypothetical protein CL561_13410 [Alphaproteobacteria bacterium]|nr:hypothetical protein [Alphaproteobacteria bacterium]|tara:strand:- start:7032 stop:7706 length:675 start_codon:yes stop_codon:yes gene_type:complete
MYLRDLRKPYELNEQKLSALIEKLEAITDKSFDARFSDDLNNFIGILREKYLVSKHIKTNKELVREVKRVRTAANRLYDLIDGDIHEETELMLLRTTPIGFEECHNHSYHAAQHAKKLASVCDEVLNNIEKYRISGRNSGYSFNDIRDFMAIELARELARFGVEITAYRDGVFIQCLKEFLKAFNGKQKDQSFNIYIPEDLFEIAKICKEKHKDSEKFALLEFR